MIYSNTIGEPNTAWRAGTLRLVFRMPDGTDIERGVVDGTPQGTERTIAAMFGVLRSMRIRAEGFKHYGQAREQANWQVSVFYEYMHKAQRFKLDPEGQELVRVTTSADIARMVRGDRPAPFYGDCDDVAFAAAVYLTLCGIEPGFIVTGDVAKTRSPLRYRHIMPCAFVGPSMNKEDIIAFDPQEGGEPGFWPLSDASGGGVTALAVFRASGEHSPFFAEQ